jgi:hypothetical protein
MTAHIRANRLEVTDRFPMLGFTIRTDGTPLRAEVAVATDTKLFNAVNKTQRTLTNFYSSRASGSLSIPRGEAVYVIPSEVLARFVGNDRLYVALATVVDRTGATPIVEVLPTEGSPYISLKGLTGRSLKRVRLLPNRQQRAAGYGINEQRALEWAGDTAQPGQQPVPAVPTVPSQPSAPPASGSGDHDYDDGFGPMPPPPTRIASVATGPVPANSNGDEKPVVSQGYGEDAGAFVAGQDDPDAIGIREDEPVDAAPLAATAQTIRAHAFDAPLPDYPGANRFVPAHANNFTPRRRSDRVVDRIVIHITAGGSNINGTIAWFQDGNRVDEKTGQPIRTSAHYIVGRDGEVVQMVRNAHTAHHASAANSRSIGIEHCANKPSRGNQRDLPPTEPQYEASARLVTWLCQQYNLPIDREHIVGHHDISPGDNHDCPTSYWDWDYFMGLLRPAAGAGGTAPEVGALPQNLGYPRRAYATAQEINTPYYDPADPASALTCQANAFSQAREEWFVGVPNTTIFPHSAICLLEMRDGSGNISRGTGFYIGPNRILTCAHNLYNMVSVTIIPGKNGDGGASTEPFGRATVTSESWRIPASYAGSNKGTDLAVIDDVPLAAPNSMWFDELEQLNQSRPEGVVVCGYSSRSERVPDLTRAIDGFRQHLHAGYIASLADDGSTFSYPILTLKRASGSPVYYLSGRSGSMRAYVVGVHTGADADDLNRGCRLMQAKIDWIEGRTTALSLGAAQQSAPRYSARAMGNEPFSLTWDEVELVPQRNDLSCWAAAASMVIGWRDQISIDESTLASIAGRAPDQRGPLADADVRAFANALGLVPQTPQSFTVEGFRQLLETCGPLWVCKQAQRGSDSGHAVVVVGMYSDGNTAYVRIADPWDRVVGSPGAPGVYLDTHATGSRYIMTYSDFVAEYEWQQQLDNASPPNERVYPLQILHSGGTQGRLPNYGSPPAGYAQGLGERREVRLPQPPKARSVIMGLPTLRRVNGGAGGVNYALDQYDDMKAPSGMAVAGSVAPVPGPTLDLSDWPYLDGPTGRVYGTVRIDWRYLGGMVGNVVISVPNSRVGDGYSLSITADIADGPDTAAVAALRITLRHEFSHPGETTLVAVTELTLYGDGRYERQNRWDASAQARAA